MATKISNAKTTKRQFVQNSTKKVIGQETRDLIDKLLLEKLSLAEIARVTRETIAVVADIREC